MESNSNQTPDVLVIGGGPAGTTIATLLAREGHAVTLLEKGRHPRFHIGESLLPMNLPILERLGVLDQVEAMGVRKLGADFTCTDDKDDYRTYLFETALGESEGHAFEVRRSEFDHLLFENCRHAGVSTREEETVTNVELGGKGNHEVFSRGADGTTTCWRPGFVVDASGRDTLVAAKNGWKTRNRKHASAAIFGHFEGVERRPGANAGNISVYWFPHGWIWMIPLRDGITSVGAVCWPDYLKTRRGDLDAFLKATLDLCPAASERMRDASPARPAQATGNYSYGASKLAGPGYLLVGDAYAFIDPVFSSGVYLAMSSAENGVPLVAAWLAGERGRYRSLVRNHGRRTRRALSSFSWFIYRFTSPAMRNLFAAPRNIWQVEQAVVSMLAGDVYRDGPIRRRLRFFRLIYGISWLFTWRESMAARRARYASARESFNP